MLVNVCKKDTEDGTKSDSNTCMVALAIRRKLKNRKKKVSTVEVDNETITVGNKTFEVSDALSQKINDFDDGLVVNPFKIALNLKTMKASVV